MYVALYKKTCYIHVHITSYRIVTYPNVSPCRAVSHRITYRLAVQRRKFLRRVERVTGNMDFFLADGCLIAPIDHDFITIWCPCNLFHDINRSITQSKDLLEVRTAKFRRLKRKKKQTVKTNNTDKCFYICHLIHPRFINNKRWKHLYVQLTDQMIHYL